MLFYPEKNPLEDLTPSENSSDFYAQMNPVVQSKLKKLVANYFRNTHLGITNQEDNGGLILVKPKHLVLSNNKFSDRFKIAGITCNKEGEEGVAIDLTSDEVHDWISKTIDTYYASQDPTDKSKRPAIDESGPSDRNKRLRFKQEPTPQ